MFVTLILEGKRGMQYRVITSRIGHDVGGGVLFELQQWNPKTGKWRALASGREKSDTISARALGGWLTEKMPAKEGDV